MSDYNTSANEGEKLTREFIQLRMKKKDISMHRIQKLTGVNETTVGRWLRGETSISFNNFLKICGALEIRPYLVEDEDDDNEMQRMFFN